MHTDKHNLLIHAKKDFGTLIIRDAQLGRLYFFKIPPIQNISTLSTKSLIILKTPHANHHQQK